MKNYLLCGLFIILTACGGNANLAFSTTPGNCAAFNVESTSITESAPAPYCMQVTMTNNGGGNNFVNSTTASINNINIDLLGVTNVNSPATSGAGGAMDPNNCFNSSLNPGNSCTFYLQILKESYPVAQAEAGSLVLTYTVQNTLFGDGNASGSSTLNFYEITNLYIPQQNGNVTLLNASYTPFTTITQLYKTNTINLQSTAVDNSVFGYLYLGSNGGIYLYGEKAVSASISPASGNVSGANNLINTGNGNIYATPGMGVYAWNISTASWVNNGSQVVFNLPVPVNQSVHTVSPSGTIYLANSSKVYNCNPSSNTSSNSCVQETTQSVNGTYIYSLGYRASSDLYTGLYVGTTSGLYAESAPNSWVQIYDNLAESAITTQINAMTIDANGNLYAGDSSGNIWVINSTSASTGTAYNIYNMGSSGGIQLMRVDTNASPNTLYLITTSGSLYSCSLGISGSIPTCFPSIVANSTTLINPIGMKIGSELRTSL